MVSAGDGASKRARLQAIMRQSPIVAVITIDDVKDAVPLARALVAGGVTALELTLRTSAGLASAAAILREVPEAVVGVGTILTPDDLAKARQSGAHFGVSPGVTAALLDAVAQTDLPFMPGIQSASELMEAMSRGFDIVKLFPAAALGKAAIQGLGGPFPEVRFCPTGGVGEENFMEWLALPNVSAVGGSWLASRGDIRAGNWASITDRARRAMDKVRAGKSG